MNGEDVHTLADRIFKAIEAKDLVGIRSCYHDDATIWHNYDGHAQTVEENLSLLQRLCGLASSLRYTEVDRITNATGFVQRHVLEVQVGECVVRIPACLVVEADTGRIRRIYEYMDSAHRARLYAHASQ